MPLSEAPAKAGMPSTSAKRAGLLISSTLTCYFFGVAQGFASQDSLLQTAMPMPAMAQMNMALQQPVMYAQAVPVKGVSRMTAGNDRI